MDSLEKIWEHREEVIYPNWFGSERRGIFTLGAELFTEVFQQSEIDPRWLTHGVFEFQPTGPRASWIYVTSGLSNPWHEDPEDYGSSEFSGLGAELVIETPASSDWAIGLLARLLAYDILLGWGRLGQAQPLDYGHRMQLNAPISAPEPSELKNIVITRPTHYESTFELRSGRVHFQHILGITDTELAFAKQSSSDELVNILRREGVYPLTDPKRRSVL